MRPRGSTTYRAPCKALRTVVAAFAFAAICTNLAPHAAAQTGDPNIEFEFDQFGLGGHFRPGDIVPMRLILTNSPTGNLPEIVSAWVQWEVPNADGDIGEYGRAVTLQRGQRVPVWLYAPVPPDAYRDTVWAVRIFDYQDGQRRHEIGGRRIQPANFNSQTVPLNSSMIGIVGQRTMGLHQYQLSRDERPISSHDLTRISGNISADRLPDRWEGLRSFEAIAWGAADPQQLTSDTAAALREYVRNGGHLIIVLPEDANPWRFGGRAQTALDELLPQREPRRDSAIAVTDMLPAISKSRYLPPNVTDFTMGVRIFKELRGTFDAIDYPYEPLIALPDGRVIAIQRTFGHGRITIVGLDVTQMRLASIGVPHADVFWNRILGRRMDTPTGTEVQAMTDARVFVMSRPEARDVGSGSLFLQQISMPTAAGLGLMLALLLFGVYWALAGPGGFAMLKVYKRTHHAWLAFAAAAGVFTVIAWGAVGVIRISEPRIDHVTFLDHIARPDDVSRPEDPQLQRAVSWFSLYTPGYADAHVSIETDRGRRNILSTWTPPPPDNPSPFPNANRFGVSVADSPHSYAIPSRQTTTLLHAQWLGGLDPNWGGMIRESVDSPLRVQYDAADQEQRLTGRLTHNFAGPLRNVTVIWVRNLRLPNRQYQLIDGEERPWVPLLQSGAMPNLGYAWRVSQWEPGEVLDLWDRSFDAVPMAGLGRMIDDRYVERHRRTGVAPTGPVTLEQRLDFLEMLSIFNQLTPPQYFKARAEEREPETAYFRRRLAREVDLSPWLTRPSVIIIGFLEDSEIPMPVKVNDATPTSRGLTVVRWVYPLPLVEGIAFRQAVAEEEWGE